MRIVLFIGLLSLSLFAKEVELPSELNAWKNLSYLQAAKNINDAKGASVSINVASVVGLINTPKVQYIVRPVKEGGTVSYGGIFQFEIKEKGTYRIALGNASWIDLIKDNKAVISVAHGGGPENSGIRKMVDYILDAGIYTLQLSAGGDSSTPLLVTKIK